MLSRYEYKVIDTGRDIERQLSATSRCKSRVTSG
jgi:hypothetical protein